MKVYRALYLGAICLVISGCKPEVINCSRQDGLDSLSRMALKKISNNLLMAAYVDVEKTKVNIDTIRTRETNARAATCVANISYNIAYKDGVLDDESGRQYAGAFTSGLKSTKEIQYSFEETDNKEQIIVKASGL